MICADTNAHSNYWKDKRTDERGNLLELFLAEENLDVINKDGDRTFLNAQGQESVIDLMICNEKFRDLKFNFEVNEDYNSNSDHFLCQMLLENGNETPEFTINRNSTRKYIITEENLSSLNEMIDNYWYLIEHFEFEVLNEEGRKCGGSSNRIFQLRDGTFIQKNQAPQEAKHATKRRD